jgi:2-dehydro-3-deoxygalactonokinase
VKALSGQMIGVDWGTTRFRAYRLDGAGLVLERREAEGGILQVPGSDFSAMLGEQVGGWIAAGERRVLLAGMIGSRQGWRETAYLACPAGVAELAAALVPVEFPAAAVRIVPGLSSADEAGVPEVMRGEETEIAGAMEDFSDHAVVCLPGSHAKWARVEGGRILGFATHLTGEAFAALRKCTILGRMMRAGPFAPEAFLRGVTRSADPGGLLHHLFGVRALGLMGTLEESEAASYLSGLMIGHEVRTAMAVPARVHLIGAARLCVPYARAIEAVGGETVVLAPEQAARGLARIGAMAEWP